MGSGAQSHNIQDIEALGLERSSANATGFVVSPPTGAIGSPRALVGGGGERHDVAHIGPFQAATEDGQSIVIQHMASAWSFKDNVLATSLLGKRGVCVELGATSACARAAPRP